MSELLLQSVRVWLFWPSAAALVAVVIASAIAWGKRPGRVAALAGASAGGIALCCGGALLFGAGVGSSPLVRDVVALFPIATAPPLIAAWVSVAVRSRIRATWVPATLAALVGGVWVLASPLMMLLVHCSSGDCL